MRTRPQRSSTEVEAASRHIAYQLGQMVDAAARIGTHADLPMHRALLESTLLHACGLIALLLGGGPTGTVRRHEIAGQWQPAPQVRVRLRAQKTRLVEHLAGIGWARVAAKTQRWEYSTDVRALVEDLAPFVSAVELIHPAAGSVLRREMERVQLVIAGAEAPEVPGLSGVLASDTSGTSDRVFVMQVQTIEAQRRECVQMET